MWDGLCVKVQAWGIIWSAMGITVFQKLLSSVFQKSDQTEQKETKGVACSFTVARTDQVAKSSDYQLIHCERRQDLGSFDFKTACREKSQDKNQNKWTKRNVAIERLEEKEVFEQNIECSWSKNRYWLRHLHELQRGRIVCCLYLRQVGEIV